MVNLGKEFDNLVNASRSVVRGAISPEQQGFTAGGNLPSPSGNQVRQAKIANLRAGHAVRNMVRFLLPETGIVEMYVNPQSIKYNDSKHIPSPTRTRSGYLIQYWGEELGKITLSGITGSSGVEGINVLYDVYRNEQVSMDALALAAQAARDRESTAGNLGNLGDLLQVGVSSILDSAKNIIETGSIDPTSPKPTLASIAFQTEMYWSGWVFRGYFTSMSVTESADKLGLFDYNMEFTVTQKRGLRLNFMPWHRSAVDGPSNSDPSFGPPYSFSTLEDPLPKSVVTTDQSGIVRSVKSTVDQALQSYRPL